MPVFQGSTHSSLVSQYFGSMCLAKRLRLWPLQQANFLRSCHHSTMVGISFMPLNVDGGVWISRLATYAANDNLKAPLTYSWKRWWLIQVSRRTWDSIPLFDTEEQDRIHNVLARSPTGLCNVLVLLVFFCGGAGVTQPMTFRCCPLRSVTYCLSLFYHSWPITGLRNHHPLCLTARQVCH
jgi:hypothetical protein